jgi:hypothetical protein
MTWPTKLMTLSHDVYELEKQDIIIHALSETMFAMANKFVVSSELPVKKTKTAESVKKTEDVTEADVIEMAAAIEWPKEEPTDMLGVLNAMIKFYAFIMSYEAHLSDVVALCEEEDEEVDTEWMQDRHAGLDDAAIYAYDICNALIADPKITQAVLAMAEAVFEKFECP